MAHSIDPDPQDPSVRLDPLALMGVLVLLGLPVPRVQPVIPVLQVPRAHRVR